MTDLIVGGIIVVILSFSISRIVIAKKKGIRCIGCPLAGTCSKQQTTSGGCGGCGTTQAGYAGCKGCQDK